MHQYRLSCNATASKNTTDLANHTVENLYVLNPLKSHAHIIQLHYKGS